MIEDITPESTVKEIDEFLLFKKKYAYGFWEFAYSLQTVMMAYLTYKDRKKRKSHILKEMDIWKNAMERNKRLDEKDNLVVEKSNLSFIHDSIEGRNQLLSNRLEEIKKLRYKTPVKTLRIEAYNLIILVWSLAMRIEEKNMLDNCNTIATLLNWFTVKKGWKDFFKGSHLGKKETVKKTIWRYIIAPTPETEIYKEIASMFYIYCFQEANPLLKSIFPNPFDYAKWEYENIYPLSAQIQKETK